MAGRGEVAHDHAEAVVERHRDADPVGFCVVAQLADEEPVVQDVVVRQRRTLRETCGTRGVLDVDGVVGVQLDGVERPAIQAAPGLEQRLPLRAAEQHDGGQLRAARPHLGDHPGVIGGLQLLGRHEQRAARLVEHEFELTGAVRRVDVHQDRADLRGRVLGERPLGAVRRPDADPVPLGDAHLEQAERERVHVGREFGVSPPPPGLRLRPVHQRLALTERPHGGIEVAADRVAQQRRRRFS